MGRDSIGLIPSNASINMVRFGLIVVDDFLQGMFSLGHGSMFANAAAVPDRTCTDIPEFRSTSCMS